MTQDKKDRVAIVGGKRTPFVKAGTYFKDLSALDLAIHGAGGNLSRLQSLKLGDRPRADCCRWVVIPPDNFSEL